MEVASQLTMVPIAEIKPYHRNARNNRVTVEKLVELIPKVGFNVPLVLDRNNVIVKGHSRWQAGIRLGMKLLPCVYTDADAEAIKLDRLADNRVQEFSVWDEEMLSSELASLNLGFAFDLAILDFKIDLPSFEVGGEVFGDAIFAAPAASNGTEATGAASGVAGDAPGPFITAQDVAKTVPLKPADYLEVVCNHCGNRLYINKK